MYLTTKALVLREAKYKDADKILTVLTEDGKMTVKAAGALRKGCRFSAAAQCFAYSEMTLFGNAGRFSVKEASTIEQFLPLREDLSVLALANYFAAVLEAVSDEDRATPVFLQLGLNSLFALANGLYDILHIKAAFELRVMCLAGFEPDVSGCAQCGEASPAEPRFSVAGGALHCGACSPGAQGRSLPLCQGSLLAMRHIISSPPKSIFAFSISDDAQARLAEICEGYLTEHLDRRFRSLDYFKKNNLYA